MDANELTNRYGPCHPGNGVPPSPEDVREMLLTMWGEAHDSPDYNKKRWQAFEIMLELYTGIVFHPNRVTCDIIPIDMIIYCPKCKFQHVDRPAPEIEWFNPIHKSHLCSSCLTIFRTADVYTNGVHTIQSRGANDTWPILTSDDTLWIRIKKFFQKKGRL
jgi:hypothetical protein